ncbi:hypothetical protein MJO52_20280 [Microbulbifer variabilis]|uniref:Uncharacterized protein n=1 Tax=Microbulbifer variabilis TaxID=266805 RepID=A0ABY4VBN3_9GAMM|nr:hypothetical protein [Microbulbifer variabilis]USD21365.1 hypothetical protein MJO52_20280 [Microbulbifer variabilis]
MAGKHITRTATKDISDHTGGESETVATKINLGSKTVDLVTQAEALAAQVEALDDAIKSHTHASVAEYAKIDKPDSFNSVKSDAIKIKP